MTTDDHKGNDMNDFYAAEAAAIRYGVAFEGHQGYIPTTEAMSLSELEAAGGRITKVRFIGGDYIPGRGKCYDLSYAHGELPNGAQVRITHLPAMFLIPRRAFKGQLIAWAREEGVFAKALGLIDEGNFSILG